MSSQRNRFCDSCQHRVTDFSQASAAELTSALKESGSVCGRFHRSQMSAVFLAGLLATAVLATGCKEEVVPAVAEVKGVVVVERSTSGCLRYQKLMMMGIIMPDSLLLDQEFIPEDSIR